jgi:hypothetical protein
MDLEEDIPEHHLVRIVNAAVNRLDDGIFDAAYPGGGRDSYHPKMLTKVIIYAYTQRIYSSRQIHSGEHPLHVARRSAAARLSDVESISFPADEERSRNRIYRRASVSG